MTTPQTNFRPATPADLETCADVLYTADDALSASRGLPVSPRNREALVRLYRHMQRLAPDRWWVAEEDDRIIGFGGSIAYQEMVYLGFLFVLPDRQSGGVGRRLLELSMHDSTYRAVAIASYQPISAALYSWYGMTPREPIYMLTGKPRTELPALPGSLTYRPIKAAETQPLDMEVCGLTRVADHEWWEEFGRKRFGLFAGRDLVGYGYIQEVGRLGPFVVRREEHLLPFCGRLLAEMPDVDTWLVNVPGSANETFVALLHAGMRLEGPPAIYCANEVRIDHSRYLPASYALP
ncbi:MAG TPA: GNAT family N-acetyltransferase [Candidatus Limnocylindrales bacterium]|jgi:GNAT superfamily N-acetyltransferase